MRSTCAGCPHLEINHLPMAGRIASCKARRDAVVPQRSECDDANDTWKFVFWRVPLECPLPDTEVRKSAEKAPPEEWVVVTEPMSLKRPVLAPTK